MVVSKNLFAAYYQQLRTLSSDGARADAKVLLIGGKYLL